MKSNAKITWVVLLCILLAAGLSGCIETKLETDSTDKEPDTDSTALTKVGSYQSNECLKDVFVAGTNAIIIFVNINGSGFEILDISDPTTPTRLALKLLDFNPLGLYVVNNTLLYIAGNTGLYVCNIQDPAHPTDLQLIYPRLEDYSSAYFCRESIGDVMILDGLAYVTGSVPRGYDDNHRVLTQNGLGIIDSSSGRAIGSSYFSPSVERALYVSGNYVYLATLDGLEIIDITNPYQPVLVGQYCGGRTIFDISVKDNYAYVGTDNDFQIINVSNPTDPTLVTEIGVWGTAGSIFISGNRAFVSSQELNMFDITNPASPKLLAESESLISKSSVHGNETHVVVVDHYKMRVFKYL